MAEATVVLGMQQRMSAFDWARLLLLGAIWGGSFFFARIAVAEMAIGCSGADAGEPRRLGEAEARGPVLLDQLARRLEQHLFEVAVMIAVRPPPAALRRTHVKGFYIKALVPASRRSLPGLDCEVAGSARSRASPRI